MRQLNYHHLHYFWVIAREKNITRAANALHVSPSALSTQLRALESELGQALFARDQKSFVLSEAGKLAFEYAERIFRAGQELTDTFSNKKTRGGVLRVGSVATLSRNFLMDFVRPALASHNIRVVLRAAPFADLLGLLEKFQLDVILSTEPAVSESDRNLTSHLIAEYPVSLVAAPNVKITRGKFPNNLRHLPLILPGRQSAMRAPFDRMLTAAGIQPHIAAECDDMAMLRLLAREGIGVALVPPIVVKDELKNGALREITKVDGLTKAFYAVTQRRQFPNVIVNELIQRISRGDAPSEVSAPTSKAPAVRQQR